MEMTILCLLQFIIGHPSFKMKLCVRGLKRSMDEIRDISRRNQRVGSSITFVSARSARKEAREDSELTSHPLYSALKLGFRPVTVIRIAIKSGTGSRAEN